MGENMSMIYLDSGCGCGCGCTCDVFISKYILGENKAIEKLVLLNALVPVSNSPTIIISLPITVEEAKMLVSKSQKIESYIGHEATAKLLTTLFEKEIPVNRGMYIPKNKDIAIVVRLKKRLEKPEDVKDVKPEDVELLLVRYYTNVYVVEHK
jgi:hypothetical protein